MLSLDDFKRLELSDRPLFQGHYSAHPPQHSDYLFTTLISWTETMDYHFAFKQGGLIIYHDLKGEKRFRPPVGPPDPDLARDLFQLAKREGAEPPLVHITPSQKQWLEREFPALRPTPERDFFDYVYLASDLVDLPGKRYLNIRNQLNHFDRTYDCFVEPISESNFSQVKDCLRRWCEVKGCKDEPILQSETRAAIFALEHFFELGLGGLVLRIDGQVQAMSVFEGATRDVAVVHFEKAMPEFKGIYQAINRETAKLLAKDHMYINRESDMGNEGLRQAKTKYGPHHFIETYSVSKQQL